MHTSPKSAISKAREEKRKEKKSITHATHATKPKDLHVFIFEASKFGSPSQLSKCMSKRFVELYLVVGF